MIPTNAPETPAPDPTPEPTTNEPDPTNPPPDPTPEPTPDPPSGVTGIYGSAVGMDSKNNLYIGAGADPEGFAPVHTGIHANLKTIALTRRGGPNYSGGNGGCDWRFSTHANQRQRQAVQGMSCRHLPSTPAIRPGTGRTREVLTFPDPASLNQGQIYHVVFRDVWWVADQ